jgi:hypothetical protein
MPSSTLRAWDIGLFLIILISGINQVLDFRYPSIGISFVRAI